MVTTGGELASRTKSNDAFLFKAMEIVSEKVLRACISLYISLYGKNKVSIGNFILAFFIKTDLDGGLLDVSKCRKSRLTLADKRSSASKAAMSYYSACVSSSSSRLMSQLVVETGAFQYTVDVSGAYYK